MENRTAQKLGHLLTKEIGGRALWTLEKVITLGSTVGNTPFFESSMFPWVQDLEANWMTIRGELEGILARLDEVPNFQDISTDQASITNDDNWKTFFLYGMGFKTERNCARCPETTRLVEAVPGMTTAFFSILSPGKHIPAHRGLYKGFIRYHLGLVVPQPTEKCRIRVGAETRYWEEGQSLIFDDTYEHEVWNETDGVRVVLFMDVKRPLSRVSRAVNDMVINIVRRTSYVSDARKNFEEWDRRLEVMGDGYVGQRVDGSMSQRADGSAG